MTEVVRARTFEVQRGTGSFKSCSVIQVRQAGRQGYRDRPPRQLPLVGSHHVVVKVRRDTALPTTVAPNVAYRKILTALEAHTRRKPGGLARHLVDMSLRTILIDKSVPKVG